MIVRNFKIIGRYWELNSPDVSNPDGSYRPRGFCLRETGRHKKTPSMISKAFFNGDGDGYDSP